MKENEQFQRDQLALSCVVECCQRIQTMVAQFGDNPMVFAQNKDYQCAIIGQCMYLRDIAQYSLSWAWRRTHNKKLWIRISYVCNACAHPNRLRLTSNRLWFFIKTDIPYLLQYCQDYLRIEEEKESR